MDNSWMSLSRVTIEYQKSLEEFLDRTKDGCMRHPADSPAWKTFDFNYPSFAREPRNVRLGLASDGFNPFRTMTVSYSTWPVVLMPYNLPPWMCMKQPYVMLSLLIPGPSAPGNNIDVYLEPLVEEPKELWDVGAETYDASTKKNFQMCASLLWTISDFPAYANLSGWSTKGDDVTPRKRVRGPPTFMPRIWARQEGDRIGFLFNEYGQPIDKETTSSLSHFMGSLARSGKFCPVDTLWHKVKNEKKEILLDFIKEKFYLPAGSDDWLLKSFGKKVRNWRARIKKGFYDPSLSLQEQMKSKPKRVHSDQWENLIKEWNKEEYKKMSEINKKNRKNKKMMQVTGKKSYARVREELKESSSGGEPSRMELFVACFSKDGTAKNVEAANAIEQMQELNSQLPEGSIDEPGPEDIFSKVMGKDKYGRARMYGLGVRASDVWGLVPSRPACYRETMQWKSAYESVSNQVAELKAMVLEMRGSNQNASCASSVPMTSTHRTKVATKPQPLQVILGKISTVAQNDLEKVTKLTYSSKTGAIIKVKIVLLV